MDIESDVDICMPKKELGLHIRYNAVAIVESATPFVKLIIVSRACAK